MGYKEVSQLLDNTNHNAYMSGIGDGKFAPDRGITRAETVVMFSGLMMEKMEEGKTYTSTFTDITGDEWYANAVAYMEQFGIVSGFPDGSFGGSMPITRAEFVTIASKFEALTQTDENNFSDVSNDGWATDYILSAASKGWISGYADGTFKPTQRITRAEAVTIVNNMLNRTADQSYVAYHGGDIVHFSDVANNHWAYYEILEASNSHAYTHKDGGEVWLDHK